jgi:signal peptide peptidase SppA
MNRAERRAALGIGADPNAPKATQIPAIDQYWGIDEGYAQGILVKLEGISIVEAARLQAEFDAKNDKTSKAPYRVVNGTAIIPISGPMTKQATSAQFLTGGTSTKAVRGLLAQAERDTAVKSVLLHIESPGGQVSGNAELADAVRNFPKPTAAFIEDMGASCAYWVASQCGAIYANAMAEVGSIGVYGVVSDSSAKADMMGVKVHLVKSGKYKGAGTPGTPITAEHLADMQSRVDELFGVFKDAVMAGRGMTAEQLNPIADGRAFGATKALEYGLIDGICSFEECLATVSGAESSVNSSTASFGTEPARASTQGQGNQMNLPTQVANILARLKTADKSALSGMGIDPDALETIDVQGESAGYAQLKADMDRMKAATLNVMAESFWNRLITPDANGQAIATWAERDYIVETYKTLAMLDGGGQLQYDANGQVAIGPKLQAFMDGNLKRAKNSLQAQMIADASPEGKPSGLRTDLMQAGLQRRLGKTVADKVTEGLK